jgi:pimeloyl-ACP methyl ester carboxylesterase
VDDTVGIAPPFDAAGPVNGPAIVLVHGSVVTRKMWLPQLRGLADGYRVLAPDLPGHGALAHVPFTPEGYSQAVRDFAESIGWLSTGPSHSGRSCSRG